MAAELASSESLDTARLISQRYFNVFRLLLTAVFLVAGQALGFGKEAPVVFYAVLLIYMGQLFLLGFPDAILRAGLNRVVAVQVLFDILMLAALMWSSGGFDSGLAVLMMVYLAAAGLVIEGRLTLFFAALATVLVLAENGWRWVSPEKEGADFTRVGMACISFFAIAAISRFLAWRVRANASLAILRGEALHRQQAINERIIEDMQDGVIVVSPSGRVRQANPRASLLLGAKVAEGMLLADLDGALVMYGAESSGEEIVRRFGMGGKLLRLRGVLATPSDGQAMSDLLLYLRDFEEVQRHVQQSKLAALGRLTAGMAHEIRNPLNAVRQASDLLGEDLGEAVTQLQTRLLRMVTDNVQRIERLVREALVLGRFDRKLGESLPVYDFVNDLIEELTLANEAERAVFDVRIAADRTLVMDRSHLHQILLNLMVNARRYCSGKPGSVRLYAEGGGESNAMRLHVVDDGIGVTESERGNLFEPFFTNDPKGTGLGLYIARELAESNGAQLEYVGNAPGAHFVLAGNAQPLAVARDEPTVEGKQT